MKLTLNGKESDFADGLTVSELLVEQQVKTPEMVSVELNGQILKRSKFEDTVLKDGDKIEFLFFAAGGGRGQAHYRLGLFRLRQGYGGQDWVCFYWHSS